MKTIIQTFKDFLKGSPAKELHEKCGPFLKQSGGRPLYRGYGMTPGLKSKELPVKKNRQPRDTEHVIHMLMDNYFDEHFGMRVRSQGVFAIGNQKKAGTYGYPYYVFPVGDFKYLWGELDGRPIQDTLLLSNQIKDKMKVSPAKDAPAIVEQVLSRVKWHTNNLPQAIESTAEIILMCDSIIIVPVKKDVSYEDIIKKK